MSYTALAREYRPGTFAEVVGQQHVVGTLRAALRKDKLAHAYLFSGPRGCGKTTVARLLAKALNCAQGEKDDPCGTCDSCVGIAEGSYLDVLEIDAASHTGVDNIRELRDMAQYTPSRGANRVFIIDEVHMLSKGAFNALLKILEEPPARVFFFFATTEPNRIPRTILSRCQRFDFRLLSRDEMAARLEKIAGDVGVTLEPGALRLIVAQAEGSMRDALSIFDQVLSASDGEVTEQVVVELFGLVRAEVFTELNEAILEHDPARALRLADQVISGGQNLDDFAQGLVDDFRHLLLLKVDPALAASISLPDDQIQSLTAQCDRFAVQDLLAYLDRATRAYESIRRSSQPRVQLEAALVDLALMESRVLLSDLVHRLQALAGGSAAGGGGPGGRAAPSAGTVPPAAPGGSAQRAAPARAHAAAHLAPEADAPAAAGDRPAAADTVPGWTGFIQGLFQTDPGVASCLMEGIPALEGDDRLVVLCPSDKSFQVAQLQNDLTRLQEKVRESFGRRLVVGLIGEQAAPEAADPAAHRESLRRRVAPTDQEELAAACDKDRPLAELVRLLDGEAVPSQEQEDWTRPGNGAPRAPGPAGPADE